MMQHIAFIMDGNRRWAVKQGMLKVKGHKGGINTIQKVADFCIQKKIPYLSLYTFSLENFKRSELEKQYLFTMLAKESDKLAAQLKKKKIRAQFIGDRSLFPESIVPVCEKIERETKEFDTLHIHFLFCYGAQQEIVHSVKEIARQVKAGMLAVSDITLQTVQNNLWTSEFPHPELVVRTGGQVRLSNFLLYQAAYSELCFLDCLWPELDQHKLEEVYANFIERQRNFGV